MKKKNKKSIEKEKSLESIVKKGKKNFEDLLGKIYYSERFTSFDKIFNNFVKDMKNYYGNKK